jgi:hypothetical protein
MNTKAARVLLGAGLAALVVTARPERAQALGESGQSYIVRVQPAGVQFCEGEGGARTVNVTYNTDPNRPGSTWGVAARTWVSSMRLSGYPSNTWRQWASIGSIHANRETTLPLSISLPFYGLHRGQYLVELLDIADEFYDIWDTTGRTIRVIGYVYVNVLRPDSIFCR